jgi:hypothetical protein
MQNELDAFYLNKEEPVRSCFLALRSIILAQDVEVKNVLKYGMPFFCYQGKMFCYLWFHKKHNKPYIGFVEGNRFDCPDLIIEKRSRMKIMLLDAHQDLPIQTIEMILKEALSLYKTGVIKTKQTTTK